MTKQSIYFRLWAAHDNAKAIIWQFKSGEIDKARLDQLLHEKNLEFCELAKHSQYGLEQVMNALDFYVVACERDELRIARDYLASLIDQALARGDMLVLFPYVCMPGYETKSGYVAQIPLLREEVL